MCIRLVSPNFSMNICAVILFIVKLCLVKVCDVLYMYIIRFIIAEDFV